MANIIKIGSTFINLDNVCDIDTTDDAVDIYLNVVGGWFGDGEGKSEQICRSFYGDEAAALRLYLTNTAIDVMKPYHASKVASARGCTCDACRAADSIAEQNAEYYASVLTVR